MDFILENPWLIGGLGLVVSLATAYGWVQSGRKEALGASIVILVATIILMLVSLSVETDAESIRKMVYQTADDLENNRVERVLQRIHPSATNIVQRARQELGNYHFNKATVTTIHEINVTPKYQPPKAVVKMNVVVGGEFSGFKQNSFPRYVELTLYKSGKEWLVHDYTHADAITAFREARE